MIKWNREMALKLLDATVTSTGIPNRLSTENRKTQHHINALKLFYAVRRVSV